MNDDMMICAISWNILKRGYSDAMNDAEGEKETKEIACDMFKVMKDIERLVAEQLLTEKEEK